MARTPLQKQRRINDRAIRAAAGIKCRRKSTNVLITLAVIIACVCVFMTLNEYVFNIEHLPCWSSIFGGKKQHKRRNPSSSQPVLEIGEHYAYC